MSHNISFKSSILTSILDCCWPLCYLSVASRGLEGSLFVVLVRLLNPVFLSSKSFYLADIFGMRFVGAIHGRLLTAWSTAGVLGPLAITYLRQASVEDSIRSLATKVEDTAFIQQCKLFRFRKLIATGWHDLSPSPRCRLRFTFGPTRPWCTEPCNKFSFLGVDVFPPPDFPYWLLYRKSLIKKCIGKCYINDSVREVGGGKSLTSM